MQTINPVDGRQSRPIRLLLVEDPGLRHDGVGEAFARFQDISLVAVASSLGEAGRKAAQCHPDVVVVQLAEAGQAAMSLRELRARSGGARVVVVVNSSDISIARQLRHAGADDVLFGLARVSTLVDSVRKLARMQAS